MLLQFNKFVLDTDRRELRGPAGAIHVEPQVFDLLFYFAGNANRVIGKDELIKHVWHGRIVSDAALNSRINSARKAIGESGENQRLINSVDVRLVGSLPSQSFAQPRPTPAPSPECYHLLPS